MWELVNEAIIDLQQQGNHYIKTCITHDDTIVILYHPLFYKHSIFARLIMPGGTSTSEFQGDLKLFVIKGMNNQYELLHIFIRQEDRNKGYGTILMNELIACARKRCLNYIEGNLRNIDDESDDKLLHFYGTKFRFHIDENRNIRWDNPNQVTLNDLEQNAYNRHPS